MKINNFMSTQLTLNLIYDDDQIKQIQFKQALGVGLIYKIDNSQLILTAFRTGTHSDLFE